MMIGSVWNGSVFLKLLLSLKTEESACNSRLQGNYRRIPLQFYGRVITCLFLFLFCMAP